MDLSSAHFVPLVRTLSSHRKLTWQGSLFNPGGIPFSCHSVFRFRDFGTNDLGRMQAMVNRLLGAYHKWCRTSSFQLLTEHDLKYFATRRMSGYDFERISLAKAREETSLCVEGSKLKASTGDAQIFIMILKCVYEKDYDPLIDYLYFAHDKTLIYAIVALLLTDVSFLRASGAFGRLIGMLRPRIKESRAERQGLEIAFQEKWRGLDKKDAAEEAARLKAGFDLAVRTESYLIFALSLFGFLDTTNEYHSTILEVLGGQGWTPPGIAPEGLPLNFVATMRETRTLWAACMLAFFTDRPFRDATAQSSISRAMLDQAKINDTVLSRIQKSCEPDELPDVLAAIANIDGLRTELREYNLKLPEEAIRLMHKQLILQPSRHNPIQIILDSIKNDLDEVRQRDDQHSSNFSLIGLPEQKPIQRRLESGWDQVSILQRIGEAAGELFSSTDIRISAGAPKRVIRLQDAQGERSLSKSQLEHDIRELSDILLKIRQHNSFTKRELDQYNWIFQHIRNDLWGFSEDSLIPSLCHFIVPVVHTLEAALADAAGELLRVHNAQPLVARLKREASELSASLGEHYALAEPDLLSEAFRNVFTNMRHALDGEAAEFKLDIELKEVADQSEPANGSDRVPVSRQLIRLDIVTPGDIARVLAAGDAPTTLARQKAELRDFGVLLGVSRPAEGDGVRWRFTLRSRRDHVHMLRRDLGRIGDISSLSAVRHIFRSGEPNDQGACLGRSAGRG